MEPGFNHINVHVFKDERIEDESSEKNIQTLERFCKYVQKNFIKLWTSCLYNGDVALVKLEIQLTIEKSENYTWFLSDSRLDCDSSQRNKQD